MIVLLLACQGSEETDIPLKTDPDSGSFQVLTYNVHGLPSVVTGSNTEELIAELAPLLKGYELIGLQEDFMEENHEVILAQLEHQTAVWFSEQLDDRYYGSGLSTFSDFTLIELHQQHYSSCHGVIDNSSDCLASKGFVRARLQLAEGVEVDVYNTHMEAGGSAEDAAVAEEQVEELVERMLLDSADRAMIFMGDTNLKEAIPEEAELLRRFTEEVGLEDCCEAVSCPAPGQIDRIFIRSSAQLQLEAESWAEQEQFVDSEGAPLSDHPAIACLVSWSKRK
jgi:endonuclease/exonuclease/phosphatase family metal-dependent hydrolase